MAAGFSPMAMSAEPFARRRSSLSPDPHGTCPRLFPLQLLLLCAAGKHQHALNQHAVTCCAFPRKGRTAACALLDIRVGVSRGAH